MNVDMLWNLLRWVFATYYLMTGIAVTLSVIGVFPFPVEGLSFGKGIDEFLVALWHTGFVFMLMAATDVISGALLLNTRTAALGAIILAPEVVVIFFTHWFLDGGSPAWGSAHLLILIAIAWRFKSAYASLFDFSLREDRAA